MKRVMVLGGIVFTFVLAAAWTSMTAQQAPAAGQGREGAAGRGAAPGGGVGAIQKVTGNIYWIPGAGGNTAAYVTAKGVVLVDTKLANNGQAILDQVKTVSDKPITHIINTHTHGDHNGSNQFFPASVEIVVQENTAKNMQKMEVFQQAENKHGLPDRTYKDRLTLLSGDESIDLFYFGRAHTDGDTFVLFRNARVLHTGDAFANRGQPNIDLNNGGSGIAYPDTLAKAASTIKNVDTIIAGHNNGLLKHEDLVNQAEFTRLMLTKARESVKAGKTPEDAMKEFQSTLPAKFKDYNLAPGRGGPGGAFVPLFEELKQTK
jgi:glyoxylase-like metal-dependent hydrolase (beta-lactamase superfamily II)